MTSPHAGDDHDALADALTDALLPASAAGAVDPIDRIVRATLEVLAQEGTSAVTFARVAGQAGVGEGLLASQFEDPDHLIRVAFERTGDGLREVVESAGTPADAVHLILPALAVHEPYAQAFARVVLDDYGLEDVQQSFPLAQHLVSELTAERERRGSGPVDPRVAAAAVLCLSLSWHFNGDFLARAYGFDDLDEIAVRKQLSTVLEGIVSQVSGPRLA